MSEQHLLERQNGIIAGVRGGMAARFGWISLNTIFQPYCCCRTVCQEWIPM
jgi:hypothetical protein